MNCPTKVRSATTEISRVGCATVELWVLKNRLNIFKFRLRGVNCLIPNDLAKFFTNRLGELFPFHCERWFHATLRRIWSTLIYAPHSHLQRLLAGHARSR